MGCGIDLERIARFDRWADPSAGDRGFLFSERELGHARSLAEPRAGLCAAFCCKEALYKALGSMFEYAECELLLEPRAAEQQLLLAPRLIQEQGIGACTAVVQWPGDEQCLAVVYVFGEAA